MRTKLALALVASIAAACGSSSAPATPTLTAPLPSVASAPTAASPTPTLAGTASPSANGAAPLVAGPISPGEYTATLAGSEMTFTVGSAWIADSRPDVWSLDDSVKGALSVVPFVGKVFSDPCSASNPATVARSAASLIKQIQANKHLKVGQVTKTKLAGHDASQVDLTANVLPACPGSPHIYLWVLPTSGEFHLDENESARIIAADVADKTFVAVLETLQGGDHSGLIAVTQPILESLAIH